MKTRFFINELSPFWKMRLNLFTPQNRSIILVTFFLMITGNLSLYQRLLEIYPFSLANLPFLISLIAFFTITTLMFFLVICFGRATHWILAFFLVAASQAAYYMDQYGVIIDTVMVDNILETNPQEFAGLVNFNLLARTLCFGIIPAFLVLKYRPAYQGSLAELKSKSILMVCLLLSLAAVVAPFYSRYFDFVREHKITRTYANPTFFTYSLVTNLRQKLSFEEVVSLKKTAPDAVHVGTHHKNELIIVVVGETSRYDRFSLNGYSRETNPLLRRQTDLISLSNVSSCGTSTGESVPCMFSAMSSENFDRQEALHMENVLDVLFEHGVQILWRDNNSDSKGVAKRVKYEDFKSPTINPVCDKECRDIGMLSELDAYIKLVGKRDALIVLHQMGNHGPEYYRRYPKEFERFKPVCMKSNLRECSQEEIDNAFDNSILYTDYFLDNVIKFLKKYDGQYETAMLYVSDHGESLGEYGVYLHAAPYQTAPKEQTHVPAIVWMGKNFDYKIDQVQSYKDYALNHDDLYCMLLIGFEISTKTCEARAQILQHNDDIQLKN